jgi:Flp pilus assembly protein TadG
MNRRQRSRQDRGASAVEFALVLPLLVTILFGVIDFGYFFGQFNEVRHAAREGARMAAVSNVDFDQDGDADFDDEDIRLYTCDVMNLSGKGATVTLTQSGTDIGSEASVEVQLPTDSISGFLGSVVPSTATSIATFRLEVIPTWSVPGTPGTCP